MILSKSQFLILFMIISIGSLLLQFLSFNTYLSKSDYLHHQQEFKSNVTSEQKSYEEYNEINDDLNDTYIDDDYLHQQEIKSNVTSEQKSYKEAYNDIGDGTIIENNVNKHKNHLNNYVANNASNFSPDNNIDDRNPTNDTYHILHEQSDINDTYIDNISLTENHYKNKTTNIVTKDRVPVSNFLQTSLIEPRTYPLRTLPFPCFYPNQHRGGGWVHGLVFIKVHKTGSTTISEMLNHLRITYPREKRIAVPECKFHTVHEMAYHLKGLHRRNNAKSFLFSWIREPTSRYVSAFWFWQVSINQLEPTLDNFLNITLSPSKGDRPHKRPRIEGNGGYQVQYLSLKDENDGINYPYANPEYLFWHPFQNPDHVLQPDTLVHKVQNVLQDYDFIGITERMDESLVALSILLGIEVYHVVYIPERQHGSYSREKNHGGCVYLQSKSNVLGMEEYINSDEFKARNAGDILLYEAAVKSLDMTIENIGRDVFNTKLAEFQLLQGEIEKKCTGAEFANCSQDGKPIKPKRNAYSCFENIVKRYKKMKQTGVE